MLLDKPTRKIMSWENTIAEDRCNMGAPTPSQSGRRPKTMEEIMRLGFEGESFITVQHMAKTTPR